MCITGSCVRGHYKDHIPEVDLAALVVAYDGIVHHLQQEVVNVLMSFFYLVEKEDTVWVLAYCVGQDASVVIAYISGRGAD